jgi:hypothetical protein
VALTSFAGAAGEVVVEDVEDVRRSPELLSAEARPRVLMLAALREAPAGPRNDGEPKGVGGPSSGTSSRLRVLISPSLSSNVE